MSKLYKIENFIKKYQEKEILNIKNFSINKGEIIGLFGQNGSGKSTLLRHLAFLENPTSGSVFYQGVENITNKNPLKKEIAILFPEPYLLKRSIKENLIYPLKAYKIKCDYDKKAQEIISLVGLDKSFLNRHSNNLSSGEKQRVALGTRLITNPKTLLLDEPTSSLDEKGIPLFADIIANINKKYNTTFIIVSHDKKWLKNISNKNYSIINKNIYEYNNFLKGRIFYKNDILVCKLDDNQIIEFKKTQNFDEIKGIVLNPRTLKLHDIKNNISNCIKGEILSISFIQKTNEMLIIFQTNNQQIECLYSHESFLKEKFYPTQKVLLSICE